MGCLAGCSTVAASQGGTSQLETTSPPVMDTPDRIFAAAAEGDGLSTEVSYEELFKPYEQFGLAYKNSPPVAAIAGDPTSAKETENMAKEYEAFGVTYDAKNDQWYFNGEKVRFFRDVLTSNGEGLTSGKFKGPSVFWGVGMEPSTFIQSATLPTRMPPGMEH